MYCHACKSCIDDDSVFCEVCGARVVFDPVPAGSSTKTDACQAEEHIEIGEYACHADGHVSAKAEDPVTPAQRDGEEGPVCPRCGSVMPIGFAFCDQCGTRLAPQYDPSGDTDEVSAPGSFAEASDAFDDLTDTAEYENENTEASVDHNDEPVSDECGMTDTDELHFADTPDDGVPYTDETHYASADYQVGCGIPDMIFCTECGNRIPSDYVFCDRCGAPVIISGSTFKKMAEKEDKERKACGIVCSKCGVELPEGSAFCDMCGAPVSCASDAGCFAPVSERLLDPSPEPAYEQEPIYAPANAHVSAPESEYEPEPIAVSVPAPEPAYEPVPDRRTDEAYRSADADTRSAIDERLGFLSLNEVLLDEKINAFRFTNSFKVYDLQGNILGAVQQVNISGGAKAARLILGKGTKSLQQFHYHFIDASGNKIAAVHRDGGAFAKIRVTNADEKTVSYLFRGKVYSPDDRPICSFKSDWKGWSITLSDENGNHIGDVKKKWNGVGKEFFTTADKYYINISPSVTGDQRIAVFGMAIIYDILLHET